MIRLVIACCTSLVLWSGTGFAAPVDLGASLTSLELSLDGTGFATPTACARTLTAWTNAFNGPKAASTGSSETPDEVIARSYRLRTTLRDQLGVWIKTPQFRGAAGRTCVDRLRETLSALRLAEDQLALAMPRPDVSPSSLAGGSPWLSTGNPGAVKLRSGDVLLSRGNAFVSAAIAKIGVVEGDFSHLAQIYIDAPPGTEVDVGAAFTDPRVFTIEAHIEVGSFTRPFRDYVNDGNARVAQFRPKQPAAQAHRAAKTVFDWVRTWQRDSAKAYGRAVPNVNDNPPYDFKMNVEDGHEVFCAEIVSIAQNAVGWTVPMFPTVLRRNQVTEQMGITARTTFAPADLEVDPRFEQLAEWRNLDKLDAVLEKDIVFRAIYRWMDEGSFAFKPNPADYAKALLGWTARQHDLGFIHQLPKNMSPSIIALTFAIDRAGADLVSRLVP